MGPNGDGRPASGARPRAPLAVRPGTVEDARATARQHASGITEGFLSALGAGFLTRLYRADRPPTGLLPARGRGARRTARRGRWVHCRRC